ncbi:hypothetical protein [Synechococcus elongatus]|uniref:hypothetical protein n=1 Tax=Synechococcus elongatus TaxID=32046 RepID=UPI0019D6BBBC|nr:hypothetical protein [Synechococcus elongatus]
MSDASEPVYGQSLKREGAIARLSQSAWHLPWTGNSSRSRCHWDVGWATKRF